jgi:hypothetical protein
MPGSLSLEVVVERTEATASCAGVSGHVRPRIRGQLRRLTIVLVAPFGPGISFVIVDQGTVEAGGLTATVAHPMLKPRRVDT